MAGVGIRGQLRGFVVQVFTLLTTFPKGGPELKGIAWHQRGAGDLEGLVDLRYERVEPGRTWWRTGWAHWSSINDDQPVSNAIPMRQGHGSTDLPVQSFFAADASTQTIPLLPSWSAITVSEGASLSSTTVPPAATAAAIRCSATSGAT